MLGVSIETILQSCVCFCVFVCGRTRDVYVDYISARSRD